MSSSYLINPYEPKTAEYDIFRFLYPHAYDNGEKDRFILRFLGGRKYQYTVPSFDETAKPLNRWISKNGVHAHWLSQVYECGYHGDEFFEAQTFKKRLEIWLKLDEIAQENDIAYDICHERFMSGSIACVPDIESTVEKYINANSTPKKGGPDVKNYYHRNSVILNIIEYIRVSYNIPPFCNDSRVGSLEDSSICGKIIQVCDKSFYHIITYNACKEAYLKFLRSS